MLVPVAASRRSIEARTWDAVVRGARRRREREEAARLGRLAADVQRQVVCAELRRGVEQRCGLARSRLQPDMAEEAGRRQRGRCLVRERGYAPQRAARAHAPNTCFVIETKINVNEH